MSDNKLNVEEIRTILKYYSMGYKLSPLIQEVLKKIAIKEIEEKNKVVLLKRDPNVERNRIQSAYVKVIDGNTIEICPSVVGGYGADFDGDQMAVYVPISEQAQEECRLKLLSTTNGMSFNAPNFEITKEALTGLFTMTYKENNSKPIKKITNIEDVFKLHPQDQVEIYYKDAKQMTTVGRVIFNMNLPAYFPYVNEKIDKKMLNKILSKIIDKSNKDFAETINNVSRLGFKYATMYPKTISMDLLQIPPHIHKLKEELGKEKDFNKQVAIVAKMEKDLMEYLEKHVPILYEQIASGAAKGGQQIRQIMVAKGLISDDAGRILDPITQSISDGYSPSAYFEASAGSRKGTIDRSLNTASGGYAYRKVVFCVGNVEMDPNIADCGTRRTLNIKLTKELFSRMQGRYIQGKFGIKPIDESMIGTVIPLRSPVFCKTKNICKTCYGDLWKQIRTRNVGMLSASACASLSESIMKCSTGIVQVKEENDMISMKSFEDLWEEN